MKEKELHRNTIYSTSASANVKWTFERVERKNTAESKSVVKHCYTIQFGNSVEQNDPDPLNSDPNRNGYH
jgi:hypothetical protein